MPNVKIPDDLKEYFRDEAQGIDEISEFLKLHPALTPVFIIQPKTPTYPQMTFQGGTLKDIEIAATAGNVVSNKTPDAGKRWLVLSCSVTLVCDASVANRLITFEVSNGTNLIDYLGQTSAITANQTRVLGIGQGRTPDQNLTWIDAAAIVISYGGIRTVLLEGDDQFVITIKLGVVGDSYSGIIRVLEVNV